MFSQLWRCLKERNKYLILFKIGKQNKGKQNNIVIEK